MRKTYEQEIADALKRQEMTLTAEEFWRWKIKRIAAQMAQSEATYKPRRIAA